MGFLDPKPLTPGALDSHPRLSATALNDTYATPASVAAATDGKADAKSLGIFPGRKVGFIGDSHTQAVGTTNSVYAFPRQSMHIAGTFYASTALSVVNGVGGETSGEGLLRLDALLNQGIELLVIEFGANDSNDLIPLSTYSANIKEMVRRAKAKGCAVVAVGVPPKEASVPSLPGSQPFVDVYNTWLATWCPRNGVEFADIWPTLVDVTTGNLKTDLANTTNAHVNDKGHYLWAQVVAAAIRRAQKSLPVPASRQRPLNKCANGWFHTSTGTTTPTGWTLLSGGTGNPAAQSFMDDETGTLPGGKWWRLATDNTASGTDISKTYAHSLTGTTVGQVLGISGYVMIEDIGGTWEADIMPHDGKAVAQLSLRLNGVEKNTHNFTPGRNLGGGKYLIGPIQQSVTVDNATGPSISFKIACPAGRNLAFRVGGIEVVDLTARGLTDLA